ncbi:MAG: hypothetical protein WD336_12260 [Trueperaceae bacterium]
MDRFDAYDLLVRRCATWDLHDLADLLHEIDHDPLLSGPQRAGLRARLYRVVWDRARPLLGRSEPSFVLSTPERAVQERHEPSDGDGPTT